MAHRVDIATAPGKNTQNLEYKTEAKQTNICLTSW